MNIAVLFDGAGLARLGLEQAGHECTGFELDPIKHALGQHVGNGPTVLADATEVDLRGFDAVWASPPCQLHSAARTQGPPVSEYATDLMWWSLALPHSVLWVENVTRYAKGSNEWGRVWNAAQFEAEPRQNRNRVVGGRYLAPETHHHYRRAFKGVCPCVTATEYKGCASDKRRASRFYGRRLTVGECAYRQGLDVPEAWWALINVNPCGLTPAGMRRELYEAIGNGVPVYMARAFGEAHRGF